MSNETLAAIPARALAAEAGAAIRALAREELRGIGLVDAPAAAGVMLIVPELSVAIRFIDVFLLLRVALLTFAVATLTTGFCRLAVPQGQPWLGWSEFSILAGLSMAVVAFVFVPKVMRLIEADRRAIGRLSFASTSRPRSAPTWSDR